MYIVWCTMRMPQHWRTSHVYVIVVSAILMLFGVMTSFCDLNWRHGVILWRHMTSWRHIRGQDILSGHGSVSGPSIRKTWKITFLTEWPWSLTYDPDHQTWSRFHQGQSLYQVSCPYIKWFGSESADELTDGRTERRKFYYLDRWRGR